MRIPNTIRAILMSGNVSVTVTNALRAIEQLKKGGLFPLEEEVKEFYTSMKIRQMNWSMVLIQRGYEISDLSFEELRDLIQDTETLEVTTVSTSGNVTRTITKLAA